MAQQRTNNARTLTLVAAADEAFALPLAVTIRSAAAHLDPASKLCLYVLDGGLSDASKEALQRSWEPDRVHTQWLKPDVQALAGLAASHHVSRATYFRLLIPHILPASVRRAIYLDADLLVRGDLGRLWDEPQDAPCLAVADAYAPYMDARLSLPNFMHCQRYLANTPPIANYRELGIAATARYFNAGVLVVDLEYWRKHALAEKMLACLRQHSQHVRWWDQYALNVVLAGRWRELDPRWNQCSHVYTFPTWHESPFDEATFRSLRADPWIVHFTAKIKPWHYFCRHPFRREFFRYLDQTDWRGWRPTLPKGNVLRQTWDYSFAPLRSWFKVYASRARRAANRLRKAA